MSFWSTALGRTARHVNAKTVEITSSHVAMLARPEETANLILEAAGQKGDVSAFDRRSTR
jgi:hypothetical protein